MTAAIMWNRSQIVHCRSYGHVLSQRVHRKRELWRRERGHLVQFTLFRVVEAGERGGPVRVSAEELLQELQGRQFTTTTHSVRESWHVGVSLDHILIVLVYFCFSFFRRYECGGQKKFRCLMCGKAFSQSTHLKRHLESGVCIKYYHWTVLMALS